MSLRWYLRIAAWIFIILMLAHIYGNKAKQRHLAAEQKLENEFVSCFKGQIEFLELLDAPWMTERDIVESANAFCRKNTNFQGDVQIDLDHKPGG